MSRVDWCDVCIRPAVRGHVDGFGRVILACDACGAGERVQRPAVQPAPAPRVPVVLPPAPRAANRLFVCVDCDRTVLGFRGGRQATRCPACRHVYRTTMERDRYWAKRRSTCADCGAAVACPARGPARARCEWCAVEHTRAQERARWARRQASADAGRPRDEDAA